MGLFGRLVVMMIQFLSLWYGGLVDQVTGLMLLSRLTRQMHLFQFLLMRPIREIPPRSIDIANQGQYLPTSTMAVLHYPPDPFAYWTFDRHESLFEDVTGGRFQPSPAWNAMQQGTLDIFPNDSKLTAYWSFDDENGSSISTKYGDPIDISPVAFDGYKSIPLGHKGEVLRLNGTDYFSFGDNVPSSGSLSMWLKPEGDFVFEVGTDIISYNHTTRTCTFGFGTDDINVSITRSTVTPDWMHLAVVGGDNNSTFYLDGKSSSTNLVKLLGEGELETSNFIGLLTKTHIFKTPLSEAQIKILAGKTFLDLSGNKIHAVPIGPDFPMSHPDTDPLRNDRPSVNKKPL